MDYKIVNIVASTDIGDKLDLILLKENFNNCEYEPEVYFALIYKLKNPKLSILVNRSGKIIFTGAKSFLDIEKARDIFFNDLRTIGYKPIKDKITIQNIVITSQLKKSPNLNNLLLDRNYDIEYEPETMPCAIVRWENPKFTCLIFNNGKVTITGLKSLDTVNKCLEIINFITQNN